MDYRDRILDEELDDLLGPLPAIAIEGAKGVGKTASAERRSRTIRRLDDPAQRQAAAADPGAALEGPGPVLLDEWQRVPPIWDAARRAVDDGEPAGPFLLTGSTAPADEPERHTGAGRIDVLRMRPMTLPERLGTETTASLRDLLAGGLEGVRGESGMRLADYAGEIVRSGFPGFRDLDDRPLRVRLDGYVRRIVDREVADELGRSVRHPDTMRRWMAAYAAATATTTSLEKIRAAAAHGDAVPAKTTAIAYRDALTRLFLLDPVDGWVPSGSQLRRLNQAPKHHLVDPALAVSLLGLSAESLLSGESNASIQGSGPFLGALFESLTALSVRVFAQAADARVRHLRDRDGRHEIDFVVEAGNGDILAIETKLAATVDDRDVRHLRWLAEQLGDRLRSRVVVTTGPAAYRREDGIFVVPLALLGP